MSIPPRASLALAAAIVVSFATQAADTDSASVADRIKHTLSERYPEARILDVTPSPVPGYFEVFMGDSIAYADPTGNYLFVGDLMDTRTKANLTTEKVAMRTAVDLGSLPLDRSIKVVKGDGSRRMAVFADPDCPFCKELEQALESVDNVTIHTLLFPVDELHPGASKHARAIWCAPDRAAAWTAWMLRREAPPDATCQDDPIAEIRNLAIKLRLSGTPTVIFENGKRVNGLMTAADIEAALSDHNPVHPTVPAAASR